MEQFEKKVREKFEKYKNDFNYENLVNNHLDTARFQTWILDLERFIDIKDKTIFSSGCGSAGDLYEFLKRGAKKVYGVEVDQDLLDLAIARFKGTKYEKQVELSMYPGDILTYKDGTFDIAFSMHVIEHTKNPRQYLEELMRVIKPGGVIFMDLPNRYYPIEQHTLLKFIHLVPYPIRDSVIKFITNKLFAKFLGTDTVFKYRSLQNYHIPYAHQIHKVFLDNKDRYNLQLLSLNCYDGNGNVKEMRAKNMLWFLKKSNRYQTLRVVIKKS